MTSDILKEYPELILPPSATLRQAMAAMTRAHWGIILVADKSRRLLGVLADIDLRRALLQGKDMDTPVTAAMNPKPITVTDRTSQEAIASLFRDTSKSFIPVLDKAGRLKSVAALIDYVTIPKRHSNTVIVMAGGVGKRLRPLTENTPKPMLKIGDKPILELLLEQLAASGFGRFIFSVNYLGDQIRAHFGDGRRWDVEIEYLEEKRPMGTVGSLGLLKKKFDGPLLVLNGDILTKVNFNALLDFHRAEKSLATLCVKRHEVQVPYGVVELKKHRLHGFVEKPTHRFLVNAGIYVLEPKILAWLPRRKPCDMPEFLDLIRKKRGAVSCFPIEEYWLDIGGLPEFRRAENEFDGGSPVAKSRSIGHRND
jgi:dTDP-glucose pyrophosphorylase